MVEVGCGAGGASFELSKGVGKSLPRGRSHGSGRAVRPVERLTIWCISPRFRGTTHDVVHSTMVPCLDFVRRVYTRTKVADSLLLFLYACRVR